MKVAIVHDWLTGMRGGEKVLEVLCQIFPQARLYTLLYNRKEISTTIRQMEVNVSFIQKLPFTKSIYRYYLPLFPLAIESFNLKGYDLVISSSHCVAKGIRLENGTFHICYCYTPMRYIWGFYEEYFGGKSNIFKKGIHPILDYLKRWDKSNSEKVDSFITLSKGVAGRIRECYQRDAEIISPPVDTDFFKPEAKNQKSKRRDSKYFLIVSALVPYKRIDIAIETFNRLKLPLTIIGTGTEYKRLKRMAGENISFLGWQPNPVLREYYQNCEALIFPGEEEFGITALEAQACGRPVIGYGKGGLLETVVPFDGNNSDQATGIFFYPQTEEALMEAVKKSSSVAFDSRGIREHSLRFDKKIFREKMESFIKKKMSEIRRGK